MRNFIKHAVRGIIFLAILAVILLLLSRVVVPKNNGPEDGMPYASANAILSEPANTVDVLTLGDSVCYSSFISLRLWENYGFTVYNCGTSEQKLEYSEELLKKAFRNHSPKIVLLETSVIFRDISLDDVLMDEAEKIFPVFSFHDRWKSLKTQDLKYSINYTHKDYAKGYQFEDEAKAANTDFYIWETKDSVVIPLINRSYIRHIKSICDHNGAKLVIISSPSTVNWNMMRHNSIEELTRKLEIEYIDLNLKGKEVPIDWEHDTHDKGDHLNYFGAVKVTDYIGEYLEGTGLLTDHRGDPAYQQWEEDLASFNRVIGELLGENPESDA